MALTCGVSNLPYLYYNDPPFISAKSDSASVSGLVALGFSELMRQCCRDVNQTNYTYVAFANATAMLSAYRSQYSSAALALPVFDTGSQANAPAHFVSLVNINAFFLIAPQPSHAGSSIAQAMLSVWPIVLLIWACTGLVGYVLWFMETYISRAKSPFCRTFGRGIADGFWNAFITAGTIGYGDTVVHSLYSRVVICLWITFASMMFSSMTGTFSSVLTSINTAAVSFPVISGSSVSVMADSAEFNIVVQSGGIPVEASSMSALINSVASGSTAVGLVNVYTYAYQVLSSGSETNMLQGMRRQVTTQYSMQAGFIFGNTYDPTINSTFPSALYTCFQQQSFITQMISAQYLSRQLVQLAKEVSTAQQVTSQLFQPTEVAGSIGTACFAIFLIVVTELIFHYVIYPRTKNLKKAVDDGNDGSAEPYVNTARELESHSTS